MGKIMFYKNVRYSQLGINSKKPKSSGKFLPMLQPFGDYIYESDRFAGVACGGDFTFVVTRMVAMY